MIRSTPHLNAAHRRPLRLTCVIAGLLCAIPTARAQEVTALLTADTEGHLAPCTNCPTGTGLGGMARRATLLQQLRQASPNAILVDAGNLLAGPDSVSSAGRVMVTGYNALGYQAVNLSHRDLRFGKDRTLAALKDATFATVSANLLDESTGQPLVKPFVTLQAGAGKVAVIGVCEPPPGLDLLPHLKEQLAGVRVAPPAEALAAWLPKAKAEAGAVILLYYGSPQGLTALREKFGADLTAVLVGGTRPDTLPADAKPPVIGTGEHGKFVTRAKLSGKGAKVVADVAQHSVAPALAHDAAAERAIAAAVPAEAPPVIAAGPATNPAASLPNRPEPGKVYPSGSVSYTRGVRLRAINASLTGTYGAVAAPAGGALFVVATEWENVIPWTLIGERKIPTEYQIPRLGDHLYLVADGRHVARVIAQDATPAGHVPLKDFKLSEIGDRIVGNVIFTLPAALNEFQSLELRFYDFAHGHMVVPLIAPPSASALAPKPLAPPQKNEVVEAAVFGMNKFAEWNGAKAPQGMAYVVADLRARSLFTYPGDATAFDPKAKPGAKMQIGTVADWTEAHRYCQLVVDGERAYMPVVPGTTLPDAPRFLPDVMTGGQVVFLAPAEAKSLELRCDFPNAKKPDGQVLRPKGVLLSLEGKRPALATHKPIASVNDDVYRVAVTAQSTPDTFAGAKAPDGKRLFVLDVLVENVGQNGELFQTKEQLKCATSEGAQVEIDPLTYQGLYRPTELVFIPPRERRTFQVAYAIPASETRPRLAYGGISLAKNLDLQPIEAGGATAVANAPPAPAPAPAPAVSTPVPAANAPAQPDPAKPQAAEPPKTQVAVNVPPKPEAPKETAKKQVKSAEVTALRVPAKQPHEPKGLAGVGLKPEQVNESIDRGAAFLWNYIKEKDLTHGYDYGYRQEHMLAALALVHAEAHKKFPDFDTTVRKYIAQYDPVRTNGTYMNGLYCMLIEAYGDPTYLPQMRKSAQWLLDTQGPDGTWGYGIQLKKEAPAVAVRRVLQVAGGRPLDEPAGGEPLVRKTKWEDGADGDNSVTQYALLGLHAATRFEVKLPKETWERTLKEHRKRQDDEEGGFAYTTGGPGHTYGSMTCAGICALALARHQTGVSDFANDEGIERGLAWMVKYFTVEGNPYPTWGKPKELSREWHYYYLYSLERVGRILDTEFIGPHEWYPLGAKYLLSKQRADDGGWLSKPDHEDPVLSTGFALLFLTRATATLDLPKRTGPGTLKTQVVRPAGQKVYVILDCSGTMMEEVAGRTRFDIAREALVKLVGDMPDNAQVALRAFGHSKSAIQPGADEDTELIVSMGVPDPQKTLAKLQTLRPRGKTPLARTLIGAASDLRGAGADEDRPITVLLVTDGGEDNTKPPKTPLEAAAALAKIPHLQLYVVGFDVQRADWIEQLSGLARSGAGQYLAAADGAALHREMKTAVLGLPESFAITDAAGKPVGGGEFGQNVPLPEGKYTFRTEFAGKTFEEPFWINAGSMTAVTFDAAQVAKEEGVANVSPAAPPKQPAAPPAAAADAPAAPAPAAPTAPGNKFCTSCGTKLAPGTKFCTNCGAKQ